MTVARAGAIALAAAAILAAPAGGGAAAGGGDFGKQLLTDEVTQPIHATTAPGVADRIYVVERPGTVQAVDLSDGSTTQFLSVSGVSTTGEGGLLSIAFDPGYQLNGLVYAYYAAAGGDEIRVDEFTASSDTDADEGSRRRVLTIPHPDHRNHYGGTLAFGPDGLLYLAPGDGGGGGDPDENAHDKGSLLGKVLRIDPAGAADGDYSIPASNPYVGRPGRDEIYARGLRNPFRFSFDEPSGKIAIGDVGQHRWEEVDVESPQTLREAHFGWDHFEGDHRNRYPGDDEAPRPGRHYEPPIHEYRHPVSGAVSVTGGAIARDDALGKLAGRYVYADHYRGRLRSLRPRLSGRKVRDRPLGVRVDRPTSFWQAPAGEADGGLYVTSISTGKVFRIVAQP